MARGWIILKHLYSTDSTASVSELAKKLGAHVSNVSRDLDDLGELEPKIVQFTEQRREQGGKPTRLTSLTETGKIVVGAFAQATAQATERRPVAEELKEAVKDDLIFLIKEVMNPRNHETQQAAWLELDALARSARLWKHKEVWDLLDASILAEGARPELRSIFNLLRVMLHNSQRELGPKNEVAARVKQAYQKKLEEILAREEVELRNERFEVITLFEYIMTNEERFRVCWKVWEKGAKEIKDQEQYSQYLQPFISYLTSANTSLKRSVRNRLYQLMEAPEPEVRKRALEMLRYLYA
jgi:DNA-binding MarR family transcriptional regulator